MTTCGCVKGRVNCPEAERLWDKVADAHKPLARALSLQNYAGVKLRRDFDAALVNYEAHVAAAEPEQGALT